MSTVREEGGEREEARSKGGQPAGRGRAKGSKLVREAARRESGVAQVSLASCFALFVVSCTFVLSIVCGVANRHAEGVGPNAWFFEDLARPRQ